MKTGSRPPAVSRRLVVIETDGFSVRAALVRRSGRESLAVEHLVEARHNDPVVAAGRAIDDLRSQEPRLPKQAIVVSVEVTPALLHLPLSPDNRSREQLQNALRYEMEPRVAQRAGSRQIGGILVGLGLSSDQVEELLNEQEERRHDGRPPRLGELALQKGYASREQVKDAVELQRWFTAEDADLACGWSVLGNGGSEGRHTWLVAGLCRERRKRWQEMLRDKGLDLEGVYPLAGSAGPSLGRIQSSCACIQLERGMVVHSRLNSGRPEAMEIHYVGEKQANAWESFKFLAEEGLDKVWICGRDAEPFMDQLSSLNGCRPEMLEPGDTRLPESVASQSVTPMLGAARHALRMAPKESAVCVPARDPGAPLLKRPIVPWIAAAVMVALICLCAEFMLNRIEGDARDELMQAEALSMQKKQRKRSLEARVRTAEKMTADREKVSAELEQLRSQVKYYVNDLPHRALFLPALLEALSVTVNEEIFIESVSERQPYCVEIKGLALTDTVAHEFYRSLSKELVALQLELIEQSTSRKEGGVGEGAYTVHAVFRHLGGDEQ